MELKLNKPLIILDIESTGINFVTDKIVELYLLKIRPNGEEKSYLQRFNPGVPIPADATAVHGISNKDVEHEPSFQSKAGEIMSFIGDADLAGFNSNKFDVPMLMEELGRCGLDLEIEKRKLIDVQRIFHQMEPRNLEAAYQFYCNKSLENAHTAEADTIATWEVLKAQVAKYETLDRSVEGLHKFSGHDNALDLAGRIALINNEALFNFGKYKGKRVKDVFKSDAGYYDWLLKTDFPTQTKKIFTRLRLEMMKEAQG